jgi:hypothetical protein
MMVFGGFQKPMIVGYSGCSVFLQTLHLLFVVYQQKKGAIEGFSHTWGATL